ncbi:hypothetical protein H1P_3340001 [Hyella patelloides LEGE 07179]|uniref:Uncharacterized protein n=2 Tax=Hyella TaxID=945733 RepID=A0A563VVK0_9CYAN|nr:hypothetical protein H1P_3340001 [Hyella patelloides LEGE 07179]
MNQIKALQNKPFDAKQWQKLYYHHPQQLIQFFASNQFLSAQQVQNTLNYIFSLPT